MYIHDFIFNHTRNACGQANGQTDAPNPNHYLLKRLYETDTNGLSTIGPSSIAKFLLKAIAEPTITSLSSLARLQSKDAFTL